MSTIEKDAALRDWEAKQHEAITGDPLWRLDCYREALFLVELAAGDQKAAGKAGANAKTRDQLLRAVGSVAANIAESYGRPTIADRVRFLSYALGSGREAVAWYVAVRSSLDPLQATDRMARLARIRRMLLGLLSRVRDKGGKKFDPW